jgi:hypothetical protein
MGEIGVVELIQAGGNQPRQARPKYDWGSVKQLRGASQSSLTQEAGQGGQVEPDIGQHNGSSTTRLAKDGKALETPLFKGSIATFRSIARAVVEGFPHGAANQDIAHQAAGTVGKTLSNIKDETSAAVGGKVGTSARRLGHGLKLYHRLRALGTDAVTEVLASLTFSVIAIGSEAIAEWTQGTTLMVVTAQQPVVGVFVRFVTTQVNNSAGVQVTVDNAQDQVGAEGGVAGDSVHV